MMVGKGMTDLPEFVYDWLRSALASYAMHLAGKLQDESCGKRCEKVCRAALLKEAGVSE